MIRLKYFVTFVVLLFNTSLTYSQVTVSKELNTNEVNKLSSLCKVWGFLKYYHPSVAKGDYNWDEQLINIMPKIEKADTKEEISQIYLNWIESLGFVKECKSCKKASKNEYFDKNFDLSWLQDGNLFTKELSTKLKYIEENRFQGDCFYAIVGDQNNIELRNEPKYENFEFPDQNYRLVSLFRYWNVIEYFYPYKYQTDQNWNEVLSEMIPKFRNANNATEYHLAMLETVVKLNDTHATIYTNVISDFFGRKRIPAYCNIIEGNLTITGILNDSLAKINDIRIGDVIEKAEEINVSKIMPNYKKYNVGSNDNVKALHYGYFLTTGTTDSIKLTIKRGNIEITKNYRRYDGNFFKYHPPQNPVKYKILEQNIGYVDMTFLEMKDVDKMMTNLQSTKAIIIDYREYMKFTPYMIARRLIQNPKEYAKFIEPDLSYPGRFVWDKSETITPIKNKYYSGKVIVLVNESTQSASEYATMLLQAGVNTTTIGSQTAGADGNVSNNEFIGFTSKITGLGVFYPDGSETQRKGIRVDVEVLPTVKGLQEGKDEVLEKALEFCREIK